MPPAAEEDNESGMATACDGGARPAHWFFKRNDGMWHPYSDDDNATINLADALEAPAQTLQVSAERSMRIAAQLHRNLRAPARAHELSCCLFCRMAATLCFSQSAHK